MTEYENLLSLQEAVSSCRQCAEAGYEIQGLPVFSGDASARLMLIGQAPGVTEAEMNRPFNGSAGRRLFQWLERAGWEEDEFRADAYISSVTKCFPGKAASGGGDRVPSAKERALCRPWLDSEMAFVAPELIITVGKLAGTLFFGKKARLGDMVGEKLQSGDGPVIVPLPHPSGASRWHQTEANREKIERAIEHLRRLKLEYDL